jgi:ribA/ribD-fused uncharacterized protein
MSMGPFPDLDADNLYLSRSDVNEELGTFSKHGFFLEDREWPSVEHYYQASKFENESDREKIRQARHPREARKMGRSRSRKRRPGWRDLKKVYMTRAVYTKCRTYPAIAAKLLATGEKNLLENTQFDYYWGCGRDRRGHNVYGRILMNVRAKLREEADPVSQGQGVRR